MKEKSLDFVTKQFHLSSLVTSEMAPSRIFASPKLEIFVTNNSRLPDAIDCHKGFNVKMLGFSSFSLCKELLLIFQV